MLDFSQMFARLAVALALGAILGLERELIGKEAGIRTGMLVGGGAALFTIAALELPYLLAASPLHAEEIIARNGGFFGLISNIVVGIGFLGAGIIFKTEGRVRGLTTAAVVWTTAGIGILAGIGLFKFAATATLLIAALLYLLKNVAIYEQAPPPKK